MTSGEATWTFAYGSNMDLDALRGWLRDRGDDPNGVLDAQAATLPGYRLVWNYRSQKRDAGAANAERAEGDELPGVALQVDSATLKAIDEKEGHPKTYRRDPVSVRLRSRPQVQAWPYMVVPDRRSPDPVWPRRAYLQLLLNGARGFGLPDWHIRALEETRTVD